MQDQMQTTQVPADETFAGEAAVNETPDTCANSEGKKCCGRCHGESACEGEWSDWVADCKPECKTEPDCEQEKHNSEWYHDHGQLLVACFLHRIELMEERLGMIRDMLPHQQDLTDKLTGKNESAASDTNYAMNCVRGFEFIAYNMAAVMEIALDANRIALEDSHSANDVALDMYQRVLAWSGAAEITEVEQGLKFRAKKNHELPYFEKFPQLDGYEKEDGKELVDDSDSTGTPVQSYGDGIA